MKVLSVVGARPNFMKLAPLAHEFARHHGIEHVVVHTGQHYDLTMSDAFFEDLELREPDHHLAIGSGSHTAQAAAVLARLEPVLEAEQPDVVLVYGDVNSTVAAALGACQLRIPVAHVEAGLRSRDRSMPEELNRIITDHISDMLFAPSEDAAENLRAEGIPAERIHFVGNIMIDSLVAALPRALAGDALARYGVQGGEYVVATLHRPSNVDDQDRLEELMNALQELGEGRTVLFPLHPRTRRRVSELEFRPGMSGDLRLLHPLGYLDMLGLVASAALVITDSGGLQEETTYLGVPCLTVRPNTERPITCTQGTNRLVAPRRHTIMRGAERALARGRRPRPAIERWDGHTAERITAALCGAFAELPELMLRQAAV